MRTYADVCGLVERAADEGKPKEKLRARKEEGQGGGEEEEGEEEVEGEGDKGEEGSFTCSEPGARQGGSVRSSSSSGAQISPTTAQQRQRNTAFSEPATLSKAKTEREYGAAPKTVA